jgi:hypothetical protein
MHWLWVILIGLVIGAVAKLLMPGKDPGGFIIKMRNAHNLAELRQSSTFAFTA